MWSRERVTTAALRNIYRDAQIRKKVVIVKHVRKKTDSEKMKRQVASEKTMLFKRYSLALDLDLEMLYLDEITFQRSDLRLSEWSDVK